MLWGWNACVRSNLPAEPTWIPPHFLFIISWHPYQNLFSFSVCFKYRELNLGILCVRQVLHPWTTLIPPLASDNLETWSHHATQDRCECVVPLHQPPKALGLQAAPTGLFFFMHLETSIVFFLPLSAFLSSFLSNNHTMGTKCYLPVVGVDVSHECAHAVPQWIQQYEKNDATSPHALIVTGSSLTSPPFLLDDWKDQFWLISIAAVCSWNFLVLPHIVEVLGIFPQKSGRCFCPLIEFNLLNVSIPKNFSAKNQETVFSFSPCHN